MGYICKEELITKNIGKLINDFTPPKSAPLKWKKLHEKLKKIRYCGREELIEELKGI
jgi:hypothetical protein